MKALFETNATQQQVLSDTPAKQPKLLDTATDSLDGLHTLAKNLLDPEMYGHAVTAEVRDAARRALGRNAVETITK